MQKKNMSVFAGPLREYFTSRGIEWSHVFTNRRKTTSNVKFWYIMCDRRFSVKAMKTKLGRIEERFDFIKRVEFNGFNKGFDAPVRSNPPSIIVYIKQEAMEKLKSGKIKKQIDIKELEYRSYDNFTDAKSLADNFFKWICNDNHKDNVVSPYRDNKSKEKLTRMIEKLQRGKKK